MVDEIRIQVRCSLCDASSNDVMIIMGLYGGREMYVCMTCILEDVKEGVVKNGGKGC